MLEPCLLRSYYQVSPFWCLLGSREGTQSATPSHGVKSGTTCRTDLSDVCDRCLSWRSPAQECTG